VVQVGVEWLKRLLREHGMTQKELAARLGVSSSLVSSWLSGTKAIAPRHLREIARLFSLSEQEVFSLAGLLSEAEVSPEVVMVPVLSESIPCGTPKEAFDEYVVGLHPMLREMLELGVGKAYRYGLKLYFLRAEGDSMVEAGITPGSFVLFSPDLEVQSGDIAVVEVDEEGLTVKQVFLRGNLVVLQPRNSRYEPRILEREEVSIKGKVLLVLNYLNHLRRV
jgi:repressor LexA